MRALRNCDFCADDAVGAFEIVPPELEPTKAEQRRVVCCSDCSERLETLLEPLLARAGAETAVETDDGAAADVLETTDDESATDGSSLAVGDELTSTENEPNTVASREEGITFERDERPTDTETADDAETPDDAETSDDAETPDDAETSDDAETPDDAETANEDSPSASTRPPATYRKVIRLLRNREFPMTRSAVEELAAGAYDLERHEVEAVVDYAVETDEFVEEQGTLRRP
ncbi:hypothetical protein [Natrinema sp. H-ect4]|uniref:hypothetical protein n=1 Tax=Natrinema sp. H-ect4 TaxID=3242699 RepID=UPI0035A86B92